MSTMTGLMPAIKTFTKKPHPITAIQITDENAGAIARMVNGVMHPAVGNVGVRIYFSCCNGRVRAEWGDWIVKEGRNFSKLTNEQMTRDYEELTL